MRNHKIRKKRGILAALLCACILVMSSCDPPVRNGTGAVSPSEWSGTDNLSDYGYHSPYHGELGSAGALRGRTAIISIFTDDADTSWNYESGEDGRMIDDTLENLGIATEYLTEQAARYGSEAEFIWDWKRNPDLRYTASFGQTLVTEFGDMYEVQKNWVLQNIDEKAIKNKYLVDNVIYFFFFNTEFSNQVNPWYLGYSCSPDYYVEFCNIYVRFDDKFITKPPSYAHEMLHCFGAHDLYYANEFITQEYVDHMNAISSKDIMFMVYDSKDIPCVMTELDAYYVGILNECADVTRFNLAKSEHIADDN